jgi:hypothetical protein
MIKRDPPLLLLASTGDSRAESGRNYRDPISGPRLGNDDRVIGVLLVYCSDGDCG